MKYSINLTKGKSRINRSFLSMFEVNMRFLICGIFIYGLFQSTANAGISTCYNPDNSLKNSYLSGNPIPGCDYYDIGLNVNQSEYDQIKTLLKTVPVRYIKRLNGNPVEITPAEKVAVDDALALQIDTQVRTSAKNQYNGNGDIQLAFRCLVQEVLKPLNQVRTDPAGTYSAITLTQAKTAIQNCVDNKDVDE